MGKDSKYDNLISLVKNLFSEIVLDGFKDSTKIKIQSVLQTILDVNDPEVYFDKNIVSFINIVEYNNSNLIIDILLKKIRISVIQSFIVGLSEPTEDKPSCNLEKAESVQENLCDELSEGEKNSFEIVNGKKRIKDKNLFGKTSKMVSKDDSGQIVEEVRYTIDENGFVISQQLVPLYNDIDYNEVYLHSVEDALTYEDFKDKKNHSSKISESDL